MRFGAALFVDARSPSIVDIARAVEAAGLESLFLSEHTHVPVRRDTAWPPGRSPEDEATLLDPFVALTAASMVTTSLRVGTAICLLSERDPIVTAKAVATLDVVSGGRFEFGVGAGWVAEELRNHRTSLDRRWTVAEERLRAMTAIWTQPEAEFHGRFVDFDPIWLGPKPIQKPHPPVWIGGNGRHTKQRVVRLRAGWMPVVGPNFQIAAQLGELRAVAEASDLATPPVTLTLWRFQTTALEEAAHAGVDRCISFVGSDSVAAVESGLEALCATIRDFAG